MIKELLLVGLGGGIGSVLRYAAGSLVSSKNFPWATTCVNLLGSFIIGIVLAMSIKDVAFSNNWKLFLATGICGGFTTFSAFTSENMMLIQNGKILVAGSYIVLSVVLGIAACFLGYAMASK